MDGERGIVHLFIQSSRERPSVYSYSPLTYFKSINMLDPPYTSLLAYSLETHQQRDYFFPFCLLNCNEYNSKKPQPTAHMNSLLQSERNRTTLFHHAAMIGDADTQKVDIQCPHLDYAVQFGLSIIEWTLTC